MGNRRTVEIRIISSFDNIIRKWEIVVVGRFPESLSDNELDNVVDLFNEYDNGRKTEIVFGNEIAAWDEEGIFERIE